MKLLVPEPQISADKQDSQLRHRLARRKRNVHRAAQVLGRVFLAPVRCECNADAPTAARRPSTNISN